MLCVSVHAMLFVFKDADLPELSVNELKWVLFN